jgi:hypothetical protein
MRAASISAVSRPSIAAIRSSLLVSPMARVPKLRPSRITVTRSQISNISSRKCET